MSEKTAKLLLVRDADILAHRDTEVAAQFRTLAPGEYFDEQSEKAYNVSSFFFSFMY